MASVYECNLTKDGQYWDRPPPVPFRYVFTGFVSSRTRWVQLVPGVWLPRARVNRWSLVTGMGRDWFDRAMKLPELTVTIAGGEYRDGDTFRATVGKSLPFLQVRS